jgi:acetyl esterase/lipase
MVPTGAGCTGARSIVIYAHGTATTKGYDIADITDQTNEAWTESALIAAMFAAQGYIVVAPNYAGYDSSTLPYHPYLNAVQQSTDMIDALTAARTAIPAVAGGTLSDGGKLFITGYSQGGFVALATHKAMQARGMVVTASAPLSGPYAMEAFGDAILFGNVDIGSTVFLPLITESYQHAYGNIYNATTDIYSSTYATGIDTLLPSAAPLDSLFAQGLLPELALFDSTTPVTGNSTLDAELAVPANPLFAQGFGSPYEILNSVRVAYALDAAASPDGAIAGTAGAPLATSPQYPLRVALKTNDLRSWTPDGSAPILLCGGHDDPTVFYSINTQTMEAFWAPQVAGGLVTPLDVDPGVAFASGGIATQAATIAATALATDLGGGVTSPTRIGTDIETAIIGTFPAYFTISAQGATPNSPQGVLVEEIAAVAAQTALAELAAGVTSPAQVGTAITTAIIQSYHGSLVPPACTLAARSFFAHF